MDQIQISLIDSQIRQIQYFIADHPGIQSGFETLVTLIREADLPISFTVLFTSYVLFTIARIGGVKRALWKVVEFLALGATLALVVKIVQGGVDPSSATDTGAGGALWRFIHYFQSVVPDRVAPEPTALSPIALTLHLTLGLVLVIYLPRFLIGLRAHVRSVPMRRGDSKIQPTISQWEVIRRILLECRNQSGRAGNRIAPEGRLIAIEAGWGMGKTFVLQKIGELAAGTGARKPRRIRHGIFGPVVWGSVSSDRSDEGRQTELIVTYFNAWSHQIAPDPEFAILETLISEPRIVWPCAWSVIPAWTLLWHRFHLFISQKLAFRIEMPWIKMERGMGVAPVPVRWSGLISRLALAAQGGGASGGASLVLVVDDVDRCAPATAQRYVTLLRRGLDLPNLAVLFPYTADQLRYKVFDMLSADLPDLVSSMEGAYMSMLTGEDNPFKATALGSAEDMLPQLRDGIDAQAQTRASCGCEQQAVAEGASEGKGLVSSAGPAALRHLRMNESYSELMFRSLQKQRVARSSASGTTRSTRPGRAQPHERLLRQLESKYVSDAPIMLPALSYLDAVQILTERPLLRQMLFPSDANDPDLQVIERIIARRVATLGVPSAANLNRDAPVRPEVENMATTLAGLFEEEAFRARPIASAALPSGRSPSIRALIASSSRELQYELLSSTIATLPKAGEKPSADRIYEIVFIFDALFAFAADYMIES